jgi:luciferase family oxidoreductase group 1
MAWSGGLDLPELHPFRDIMAQPQGPDSPQIWVLGSSDYGAQVAAFFGLPYCFAYFFSDGAGAAEALELYRSTYRPTQTNPHPYSAICVLTLAADTQAEADRLLMTRDMWRAERERGRYVPLPSPDEAAAYKFTNAEITRNATRPDRALFGTADRVAASLRDLAARHGVDEIAIVTPAHDPEDRRRSFTLLALEFGLNGLEPSLQPEMCVSA